MYQVNYYINHKRYNYNFSFNTIWGAVFKARAIFEEHGFSTDVMNTVTGEILAIFSVENTYIDNDLETDIHALALNPLS